MNAVEAKNGKSVWQIDSLGQGFGDLGRLLLDPGGRLRPGLRRQQRHPRLQLRPQGRDDRLDLLDRRLRLLGPGRRRHPPHRPDGLHRLLRRQRLRAQREERRTRWIRSTGGSVIGSLTAVGDIVYAVEFDGTSTTGYSMKTVARSSAIRAAPTRRWSQTAAASSSSAIKHHRPASPTSTRSRVAAREASAPKAPAKKPEAAERHAAAALSARLRARRRRAAAAAAAAGRARRRGSAASRAFASAPRGCWGSSGSGTSCCCRSPGSRPASACLWRRAKGDGRADGAGRVGPRTGPTRSAQRACGSALRSACRSAAGRGPSRGSGSRNRSRPNRRRRLPGK